jgi:hypothetical protein
VVAAELADVSRNPLVVRRKAVVERVAAYSIL